jgi:sulfatase modifying factor 1
MKRIHAKLPVGIATLVLSFAVTHAQDPVQGTVKKLDLGGVKLEVVFIPPGEFMMGSTPEEKAWATGIEGGAQPGTTRESFEGEQASADAREERLLDGPHRGQRGAVPAFVEESGFVTDAEKPGGETQVFDPEWDGYHLTTKVVHPWKSMKGKSWRDPNWGFPNRTTFRSCA